MTVLTTARFTDWAAADGVNKEWPYDFPLPSDDSVRVLVRDDTTLEIVEYTADFTRNELTPASGYIIYPSDAAAVAAGFSVRILRETAITQSEEIGNEGAFHPVIHERAFDRATMIAQEQQELIDRSWKAPRGSAGGELPIVAEDHLVISDGAGGFKDGGNISLLDTATAEAAASAAAAAASEAAATTSATTAGNFATAADASADSAGASAATATAQATTATTKAGEAAASATTAGNSETAAAASEVAAAASATAAGNSEVAAEQAAQEAAEDAIATGADRTAVAADKATTVAAKDEAVAAASSVSAASSAIELLASADSTDVSHDPIFNEGPDSGFWTFNRATWWDEATHPGDAYAGEYCAIIGNVAGLNTGTQITSRRIRSAPQVSYRLKAVAMRTSGAYDILAYLNYYDNDGTLLDQDVLVFPAGQTASVYEPLEGVFTTPDGTAEIDFGVYTQQADAGAAGFWRVGMIGLERMPLTAADQATAEAGTDDATYMTPLKSWQQALIHRDHQNLILDYGAVINDISFNVNNELSAAFANIGAGGKRRLYLPRGTYRLNVSSSSFTVPEGLDIFGDGPQDTILHIVGAVADISRVVFAVQQSHTLFRNMKIVILNPATNAGLLLFALGGGKSNFVTDGLEVDGTVAHVNPFPSTDSTTNHSVFILHRYDSLFEGIYADNSLWKNYSRGYHNNHLYLNAITRRVRFGNKLEMRDFYRENIAINAPSVESSDWEFDGCRSLNCWFRATNPGYHYAIGNGKGVRLRGLQIDGAGGGIHIEESSEQAIVEGCVARLTDNDAQFMRILANNVGGTYKQPKRAIIRGNTAHSEVRGSGSMGILIVNDAAPVPSLADSLIEGNILSNFERGISAEPSQLNVAVRNNTVLDCISGFWRDNAQPAAANALYSDNHAARCTTPYVVNGGTNATWGDNNTSSVT